MENIEEVIETPATEIEPAVEQIVPVVTTPTEVVYEYQPTDDLGRSLGAKQVFKGASHQEVMDKIANANKELIKLNRDLNRRHRLGEAVKEEIPDEAERINPAVEFNPRILTDEEKMSISRDLLDPEKFDEASDKLFEAKIGANPRKITTVLTQATQDIAVMRAEKEAKLFVQNNNDYYVCPENFKTMANWMIKNGLAPTNNNFQLAYDKLKAVGLLLEAPIVREETPEVAPIVEAALPVETPANSQQEPEPVSRITNVEPQTQTKRTPKVASGLNRNNASDVGAPSKSGKLTVLEIEKMPSAEYKRRLLSEPGFQKAVDEAYAVR